MEVKRLFRRALYLGAIASWPAGWGLLVSLPAQANPGNTFRVCAEELAEIGVSPEAASAACAQALVPKDLSLCVRSVSLEAQAPPEAALESCFRVREPLEYASCVLEIDEAAETVVADTLLENCRLSLLPLRYSECVVGLVEELAIAPATALEDCIDAEISPRQFAPVGAPVTE